MGPQAYDIMVVHRKGSLHDVPDAHSRVTEGMLSYLGVTATTEDTWYNKKKNDVPENPGNYANWRI